MIHKHLIYYTQHLKQDIPAGLVVFLVALPLCLGVALASGAPLFSGLIAGLLGGLLVSWLSGSQLSVSGPAAGLTVIVFNGIEQLGSFNAFLLSLVIAGVLQMTLGYLKAGIIGAFFPSSVIKGMLAAIGLILIIKQLPHAIGYHAGFEGDESYMNETAEQSFAEVLELFHAISPGSAMITAGSLMILILWESAWIKNINLLRMIPGPLLAVSWGVLYNTLASQFFPAWAVSGEHLVSFPVTTTPQQFFSLFSFPDWAALTNPKIYTVAFTLAIIASLETLLSLEAVDKLDPLKRTAPTNRELKAQGFANLLSGLIGGIPITAVIVRSAANINAGGQTRIGSFVHGIFLLLSAVFFANQLNLIPLACLAAILLQTGYKLAKPQYFIDFYKQGWNQFIPFVVSVVAILLTDLLEGIMIGVAVGLFFVIRANYHASITMSKVDNHYTLSLNKDVSFLNKALLRQYLGEIDENSSVIIDATKATFIDHDIVEALEDFLQAAADGNISVEVIDVKGKQTLKKQNPLAAV